MTHNDRWTAEPIAAEPVLIRRVDLGLATPWHAPTSEAERKLAAVWQQVLGIDAIGAADDFFELGGDSFAATTLAAEIESTFGVRFAPADIINHSTVAKQARSVAGGVSPASNLPAHLVVGRAEGSQPPFFMVHGALGFAFFKRAFIDEVSQDRPIYLFQAPGLDGRIKPLGSIEEIASAYVTSMRQVQPKGPYYIGGLCSGAFITLEMCNQLEDVGDSVARLILLDPYTAPRALAEHYGIRSKRRNKGISWRAKKWLRPRLGSLYRRIVASFGWKRASDQFGQTLQMRAKKHRRLIRNIQRRRAGQVDWGSPEERSYSPEAMLATAEQLSGAIRRHVPRPYSGKAIMLINNNKERKSVGEGSFWRTHLGGIDYQVCDAKHKDIFGAQILETARFVRNALRVSNSVLRANVTEGAIK
jgi:thioesterase domain-containing protein/acyl carrier protein